MKRRCDWEADVGEESVVRVVKGVNKVGGGLKRVWTGVNRVVEVLKGVNESGTV